ncbi:MAG: ribonuclease HII [Bryobacteraceae bacterium]
MGIRRRGHCRSSIERELHARGCVRVAGADEAGRGSLFGPVYAAAVILNHDRPIPGLRDSKQLTALERERLAAEIRARALAWAVACVDVLVIDAVNILQASRLAIRRALELLACPPDHAILDAVTVDLALPQTSLPRADETCEAVAAASILAKVARDASMREWDRVYPAYGLARHKGYPSPEHLAALAAWGPTIHHRLSYRPVREVCPEHLLARIELRRREYACLSRGAFL